jgi:hypothetical protein
MDEAMDSDDETIFTALMEAEVVASNDDEEHLMMLLRLMALYARDGAKPQRGGSAPGCCKRKPM